MPIITSIEPQKKDGRYNIFIDGEFAFGAYKDTIYNFGLRKNDELTDDKLKEIRDTDELNFGKKVAYTFLSYKPRTEKDVRKKLKEKKISTENIDKIVSFMKQFKYLDDSTFAIQYLEAKLARKPEGKRLIAMKLAGKGVDKEIIGGIIDAKYNEETEISKARELLEKYYKKVKAKSEVDRKRKCYQHLLSKGFDYEIINNAFREFVTSQERVNEN